MSKLSLKKWGFAAGTLIWVLFLPAVSRAVPVTATEFLVDLEPILAGQDLERTRSDTNGFWEFEDNWAAIVGQNHLTDDFGILNREDVTYRHDLTWLNPSPLTYLSAQLTIDAYGAAGNNDKVYAENVFLGVLTPGITFTQTVFTETNPVTLNGLFSDGYLYVTIDKNAMGLMGMMGGGGMMNSLSVCASELTVTYEPGATDIPEPGTVALFGAGLIGILTRRRAA